MKFKHVISTLAIAGLLGLGVAGGIAASRGAVEAKAATEETTLYIDFHESIWATGGSASVSNLKVSMTDGETIVYLWNDGSSDSLGNIGSVTVGEVTYGTFSITGRTAYPTVKVYCWNDGTAGNVASTFTLDQFTEGQNLITINSGGSWDANQSITLGTLNVGTTYDVTKYGVYDGVKAEDSIGSDTVSEGDTYAIPDRINAAGYHFGGWYTDEACTVAYAAQEINADLDLYAKYTTLVADDYIYYVTGSEEATTNYIYSFGGDCQFGAWETTKVVDVDGVAEVHGVLSFNGTPRNIYKIPYSTTAEDTNVIISDGHGNQTADLPLVPGSAYTFSGDAGDADMGAALDLLLFVEGKRNAVTAVEGLLLDYSICGISAEDAATAWNNYEALSEDAKAYVDATYTWTYAGAYDGENVPDETGVSYANVMLQLHAIAVAGGAISESNMLYNVNSTNNAFVITISIVMTGVVAAGALYFISKKRRLQK